MNYLVLLLLSWGFVSWLGIFLFQFSFFPLNLSNLSSDQSNKSHGFLIIVFLL